MRWTKEKREERGTPRLRFFRVSLLVEAGSQESGPAVWGPHTCRAMGSSGTPVSQPHPPHPYLPTFSSSYFVHLSRPHLSDCNAGYRITYSLQRLRPFLRFVLLFSFPSRTPFDARSSSSYAPSFARVDAKFYPATVSRRTRRVKKVSRVEIPFERNVSITILPCLSEERQRATTDNMEASYRLIFARDTTARSIER